MTYIYLNFLIICVFVYLYRVMCLGKLMPRSPEASGYFEGDFDSPTWVLESKVGSSSRAESVLNW